MRRTIRFGVIGCGLMGREFASATAALGHLTDMDVRPELVAVCDTKPSCLCWFTDNLPDVKIAVDRLPRAAGQPRRSTPSYCAVPHHLHAQVYGDVIAAGKHLLGEKPFGIDQAANDAILAVPRRASRRLRPLLVGVPVLPGAIRSLGS